MSTPGLKDVEHYVWSCHCCVVWFGLRPIRIQGRGWKPTWSVSCISETSLVSLSAPGSVLRHSSVLYTRDFSCKGSNYIFGSVAFTISNKAIELCHRSGKAAVHNTLLNEYSRVPIKLTEAVLLCWRLLLASVHATCPRWHVVTFLLGYFKASVVTLLLAFLNPQPCFSFASYLGNLIPRGETNNFRNF